MPRAEVAPYVGNLESAMMKPFAPQDDALRLLVGYAQEALRLDEKASPHLQAIMGTHLRDLLSHLLGARHDAGEMIADGGVRAARIRAIKAQIISRLGQGDLSAESIARALNITPNYVRKLFRVDDRNFSDFVMNLRLDRASSMLRDPRLANRTISWIAFEVGFNDISYFNRSFRRRFNTTPRDHRFG